MLDDLSFFFFPFFFFAMVQRWKLFANASGERMRRGGGRVEWGVSICKPCERSDPANLPVL